ncbi:MAG: hypothetical protein RIQ52_175, partial [Pseudomonadota bacterium]
MIFMLVVLLAVYTSPAVIGAETGVAGNRELRQLLDSARIWIARKRDDLALDALKKAQQLAPDSGEVQSWQGLVALRQHRMEDASRLLRALEASHPGQAATLELADAIRLDTVDRQKLATAMFLSSEAYRERPRMLPLLNELFPQGHRQGNSGLIYYSLLGSIPERQHEAIEGLKTLASTMPDDARPLLEIAVIQSRNEPTLRQGLETMARLASQPDIDLLQLRDAYSRALNRLERTPANETLFQTYESRFPGAKLTGLVLSDEERIRMAREARIHQGNLLAHAAETAMQAGQTDQAEKNLQAAMQLDPDDMEYPLALGRIMLDEKRYPEAIALFRSVMAKKPGVERAAQGFMQALDLSGQHSEAIAWGQHYLVQRPAAESVRDIWIDTVRHEADRMVHHAQTADAMKLLESAIQLAPASGWLRYDLAALDLFSGAADRGKTRFSLSPTAAEVQYAFALYLYAKADDPAASLAVLDTIPATERTAASHDLYQHASLLLDLQQTVSASHGQHSQSLRKVHALCDEHIDDDMSWRCITAYSDMGETGQAIRLARVLVHGRHPADASDQLRLTGLLLKTQDLPAVRANLNQLDARQDLNTSQRETLQSLHSRLIVQQAWALRKKKQTDQAIAELEQALIQTPNDRSLSATLAHILLLEEHHDQALALYSTMSRQYPEDIELKLGLAEALWKTGQSSQGLELAQRLDKEIPATHQEERLDLVHLLTLMGQDERARKLLAAIRAQPSDAPEYYLAMAKASNRLRDYQLALQDLRQFEAAGQKLPSSEAVLEEQTSAMELREDIERRRFPHLSSGLDFRQLSGAPGISQILNLDAPNIIRMDDGYDGHYFVQSDFSAVFAGDLPLSRFDDVQAFGTIRALCIPGAWNSGPECAGASQLPASSRQQAMGASLAVGYASDRFRIDIGSTPVGFPVSTMVGGMGFSGSLGKAYYSADIFRRPYANSLLSYAGVHDPV